MELKEFFLGKRFARSVERFELFEELGKKGNIQGARLLHSDKGPSDFDHITTV